MEGKKRFVFYQDCRGVSEIYGQLLMMSIVVLAFSTIGLAVFSDGGVVKPEHIPNTDLREKIRENTLYIIHNGGEAIDKSSIKIILTAGNEREEYYGVNLTIISSENKPNSISNLFTLGDYIKINIPSKLMNEKEIEMFFIDTPSKQVIQKVALSTGNWKHPDDWITPHPYGSIYDNSTKEWLSTELLDGIDEELTRSHIETDTWIFQEYTFGISADEMGFPDKLSKVLLKIIYQSKDHSLQNLTLSISTDDSTWTQIAPLIDIDPPTKMEEYNDINACVAADVTYNITEYVNTSKKLENLAVKFSARGNTSVDKYSWVDYLGIHVE